MHPSTTSCNWMTSEPSDDYELTAVWSHAKFGLMMLWVSSVQLYNPRKYKNWKAYIWLRISHQLIDMNNNTNVNNGLVSV